VETINSPAILSARGFLKGNELAYPIIELNGESKAVFEFDLKGDDAKDFSYQIIHCSADWERSDLLSQEFMEGFNENLVTDYEFSTNTNVAYVNYRVTIPNDDVVLLKSGNYMLRVIESGQRDSTIALLRFWVYEDLVSIDASVERPIGAEFSKRGQELKLTIDHNEVEVDDPFNEVKVKVFQNNRPEISMKKIKPSFVNDRVLSYAMEGEYVFMGHNEFRNFDTKSLRYLDGAIYETEFRDSVYHVYLVPDEKRSYKRYFSEEDLNGQYIIYSDQAWDNRNSADYMWVYFTLDFPTPFLDGKLFLTGNLSNWQCLPQNEMQYNFDLNRYELSLLLKQGYYNYTYIYKNNYTQELDEVEVEGSHFQTENNYFIYVYHRGFGMQYDRLVGVSVINSVRE
jgi:hypothetical protein